ncbi:MAG TPA: hypothetical protein DDY22_01940 [Geobacter sp.]|nr:hypothetical protein [Geobacter sp.]
MIKINLSTKNLLISVTCVTAICILFMGMRVPDISRLHRPKPTHRAFIEKQVKPCQQAVKKTVQVVAIPATPVELGAAVAYRTRLLFAFQVTGFPPLFPNSSRAPPVLLT